MTQFIQIHALVSYAPANLNRDDLGRPKSARMGGVMRMRTSSQSLKRAWRTSELFQEAMAGTIGTRTKLLGKKVLEDLIAGEIEDKKAKEWATTIAAVYGAVKKDKPEEIEQLVHISPEEHITLDALIKTLIKEKRKPEEGELAALLHDNKAVDIAMFGRMLASKTERNIDAAVQVAHAISVHEVVTDDDYFTAVDDLNKTDAGAAHIGESYFGAAVLYLYVCIDRNQLKRNLGGDEALTARAIKALTQSVLTVGPTGKQNSHASRAYAHYALVEKGAQQPRQLSLAFLKPISGSNYPEDATQALVKLRANMHKVYGACADNHQEMNAYSGEGSVVEMIKFAAEE